MTSVGGRSERWLSLAGPSPLGRSLILTAGSTIPSPWDRCNTIVLNEETIEVPATLKFVRQAFLKRTPVVYLVDRGMIAPAPASDLREVWQVPPNLDLVGEAAWRLARANSVDGRSSSDPTWWLATSAVRAGATAVTEHGDVKLPDGRVVWCDGGPMYLWPEDDESLEGLSVVPRVSVTVGRLRPVTARTPAAKLAADQMIAVADPSSRARIIAPAGSGKTRVLTERARHVLKSGVPTESLLLVAYNKDAQREMRARTTDLPGLQVLTLNALALSILNGTNGFMSRGVSLQTILEVDVRKIISELVKVSFRTNTDPLSAWLDALGVVRLGLHSPEEVEEGFGGDVEGFADFFPKYRAHLADHGLVDFDEQIYLAIEVLLRTPDLRLAAERRAEMLLVDEFQDLTPAHMLLTRLMAGPQLPIFAVGDDDQTIYGYSGATPEWLVEFVDHVPEAVHHALEVNYRCPAPVVAAASNLMSHNTVRVAKRVRPGLDNVTAPESLKILRSRDQVLDVTTQVKALIDDGTPPSQIAVLARVNSLIIPVQVSLVEAGVPVSVRDGTNFLKDRGVMAVLAWLRLALKPGDLNAADVEFAARRPGRGLSPKVVEWMCEQGAVAGLERLAGRISDTRSAERVKGFARDIERLAKCAELESMPSLVRFIQSEIGLESALATLDVSHQGQNSASSFDSLRSLVALGRLHEDPKTFEEWMRRSLVGRLDRDGVVLATVHKVKGLEWPHVILFDATSGIFPHRLSTDIEEERRIFHVGITRCKKSLLITTDASAPSIFLDELASPAPVTRRASHDAAARSQRLSVPPRSAGERTQRPVKTPPRPQPRRRVAETSGIEASIGLKFRWGGYDCVVGAVKGDGVRVPIGSSELIIPFGAKVMVKTQYRTLVHGKGAMTEEEAGISVDSFSRVRDALRAWRLEQSRADKVPAYVIFNDETLEELAKALPRSISALLDIGGIGPAKADRYGDQILGVIEESASE
jgi:DNA helicase-2/ATP-dependent DNA helicase PcrA